LIVLSVLFIFQHQNWLRGLNGSEGLDLDDEILRKMTEYNIPSLAACIIKDDEIVWEGAYGYAALEGRVPATPETVYLLASVSKLVVVTAVMQLAESGFIDIDEDINAYLPFPVRNPINPGRKITVRMLLTHTSGITKPMTDDELPGFYDWYPADLAPPLRETMEEYLLPGGLHYVPAVWKNTMPGKRELYSNLGVSLLACLVEFVSGEDFNSYCKNRIFLPLEMPNTSYLLRDLEAGKLATWYINSAPIPYYTRRDYPAGQLKSSVQEFSHFLMAYLNGGEYKGKRILGESTIEQILSVHNKASGMCLIWNRMIGGWYGHSGGVNGASTYAEFHKQDRVGLMVFANIYISSDNPLYAPQGEIYGLIRREADKYRNVNGQGPV
jgi:CubicO group peptidase (beta-lactamase class C family)